MDLGIGKVVDTAKEAFLGFEKFSWFQRLTIIGLVVWFVWATHWVWIPRFDCSLKVLEACNWIGYQYTPPPHISR